MRATLHVGLVVMVARAVLAAVAVIVLFPTVEEMDQHTGHRELAVGMPLRWIVR